jgi:serine/threonine protein phosphatase PrpC
MAIGGEDRKEFRAPLVQRGSTRAAATDAGPVRARNEDACWVGEAADLLVVADGLGGHSDGDLASALAVEAVAELLDKAGEGPSAADTEQALRAAAAEAHRRIFARSAAAPGLRSTRAMATTLVIVLVAGGRASVLHVGDSRAYLWRGGAAVQVTIDHSPVGDLVRSGVLTREEARHQPDRNLLREVLGLADGYEAEYATWDLERGDILLLCTDGVPEALPEAEVGLLLGDCADAGKVAASLVAEARRAGGPDNATVAVFRVD